MIDTLVGDVDAAMGHLTLLAKTPGGPPYGQLKYDPAWDGLRKDPRFEPMLKALEPEAKQ